MARRLKLLPVEMGKRALELQLVYVRGGEYEPSWKPLQGHPITSLFTAVPRDVMDSALVGWTRPLVTALGIPPQGALRKLPIETRQCMHQPKCSLYIPRDCKPDAKAMPWCYEPGGLPEEARQIASEAIRLWRDGVYIILVLEDP